MMAFIPLTAFLANTILAATIPDENGWYLRRADEMHLEDLPIVDMQVTDDRFGDKVFTGTVDAVYAQMKAEKPELFADEIPVNAGALSISLAKRQSSINCGYPSNSVGDRVGSWNNCIDGMTYLMRLDRAWCGVDAAPSCARVSCSHGCGIFLCNKTGGHFRVSCGDIPNDVNAIGSACNDVAGRVWGARDFNTHYIGLRSQRC